MAVSIGVCLIFLPQASGNSGDALFDLQSLIGLIASVAVFRFLYRFWPDDSE